MRPHRRPLGDGRQIALHPDTAIRRDAPSLGVAGQRRDHPGGEGQVPSLTGLVARGRYKDVGDLTLALQFGETFGYDKLSSGGMADIQMNLAMLPEDDLRAISEYLLSLR